MSKTYVVQPGDCISSIAYDHGFFPDTIWTLSDNSALHDLRKNPNILAPGDKVVIPDKRPRVESGDTDKVHSFVRKGVPEQLRIQLFYADQPRKNEDYTIEIDGKLAKQGKTDDDGAVLIPIVPNARRGRLLLRNGKEEIALDLGRLEPVETLEGVQIRLRNMGYFFGEIDGQMSDDLEEAIVRFQADCNMEPTGEIDDPTRAQLKSKYGG
jgi:Putative peptidoglycan binding domain